MKSCPYFLQKIQMSLFAALILFFPLAANATSINYGLSNISGNTWQYDYTLENDTLAVDIEEFSIYFDLGLYENITLASVPVDWDPLIIQPDPFLPDDGFFDALALVSGIVPGASLGGFSVGFDWLSVGTPGNQSFDIFDPITFNIIDSGFTQLAAAPPVPVPEPETFVLVLTGMMILFWTKRMNWSKNLG